MDELESSRRRGASFEERFAAELGLEGVPGSGNQWISRLDVKGFRARWSLKSTKHKQVPIGVAEIDEAVDACEGPGGTGEMPLWAVELMGDPNYDLVIMRKSDFLRFSREELVLARESKAEARRRLSGVPQLMRDDQ